MASLTTSDPLAVAAFWDTRPGHCKQTAGVLAALGERAILSVFDFRLDEYGRSSSISDWWRLVFNIAGFPVPMPCVKGEMPLPDRFDLIIGTGTHTHIPMILCKKQHGGRLVTCMTPDPLLAGFFDLCIVPEHDRPKPKKNILLTLGPPNPSPESGSHETDRNLVLVGGVDKKSHVWESEATIKQISEIAAQAPEVKFTVSSSPRTPAEMLPALETLSALHSNVDFFRSKDTPPGWVEERYAQSARVWVTADSVSMIYEALTAGCVVGVLPVKWKKPGGKIPYGLERLRQKKMILDFEAWRADPSSWPSPFRLNEAGRAADEILARFFPDIAKQPSHRT